VIPPESAQLRRLRALGFGACCDELLASFTLPNSHFGVSDDGILRLATGWVEGGEGIGAFHSAVLFCPFCGVSLQSADKIIHRSLGPA
jgi:hypothetical protein